MLLQPIVQTHSSSWVVQCDFDGTISLDDVTDSLLQRFGQDGWQALEEAWQQGVIGSKECMAEQIALLKMTKPELDSHLDHLQIDPFFPAFVAMAQQAGMGIEIISDGLDYAIHRVLANHHLQHLKVLANQLIQVSAEQWALQFPYSNAHCKRQSGNCKCQRLKDQQIDATKVIFIGDGSSDFCVANEAKIVWAKDKLLTYCHSQGIRHQAFNSFAQVLNFLQEIVQEHKVHVEV